MVARGPGDVINLASVSGKRPLVRRTPYCASKMAVIGLTSTLAFEVGPAGRERQQPLPRAGRRTPDGPQLPPRGRARAVRTTRPWTPSSPAPPWAGWSPRTEVGAAVVAMLAMPGLCGADIDLSAGMVA